MKRSSRRAACGLLTLAWLSAAGGCDPVIATAPIDTHHRQAMEDQQQLAYVQGELNRPAPEQIASWVAFVAGFWSEHFPLDDVVAAIAVQTVEFVDQERIDLQGRAVHGYSTGRWAVVGMRRMDDGSVDWRYVESLFKHEVAHGVLGEVGVPWDEQLHHRMFADLAYGY